MLESERLKQIDELSNKYQFKGTQGEWHPVEYAGFWTLHDKPYYGEADLLNYDKRINDIGGIRTLPEHIVRANAYLAAAAPKLLEACKLALKHLPSLDALPRTETEIGNDVKTIISAIEKSLNIAE